MKLNYIKAVNSSLCINNTIKSIEINLWQHKIYLFRITKFHYEKTKLIIKRILLTKQKPA